MPLLVSSIFLFYAGMAFAYFVVFPIMFGFFASVTPEGVSMMTDIGQYRISSSRCSSPWRGLRNPGGDLPADLGRHRRRCHPAQEPPYVIVGCFAVGMVLTPPPDVFSQSLLAVPMWLLFEAGVICGSMIRKREEHFRGDAEDDVPPSGDQPPAPRP